MNKKGLVALGLAAFAYYRYNKMSQQEKEQMKEKVRNAGKGILDKLPADLKKALGLDNGKAEDFQA